EVHDLFSAAVYSEHPLGRLVSGTPATISQMSRRQILSFYRKRYAAPSIVVAAAGNLDHALVVRLVDEAFARAGHLTGTNDPAPRRAADAPPRPRTGRLKLHDKDTEQAHVVLGGAGIARADDRRFALGVLNNAFGGGMSSRLFQEIREKRGLAYSVYSF